MISPIEHLYNLNTTEGTINFHTCNLINAELIKINLEDIPTEQAENVCDYINNVLLNESVLFQHRSELERMHLVLASHHA